MSRKRHVAVIQIGLGYKARPKVLLKPQTSVSWLGSDGQKSLQTGGRNGSKLRVPHGSLQSSSGQGMLPGC